MPIRWETFPVELTGGLVSNLSRLQQGLKQPGSARLLQNFEPSIKGGYRRINGYTKFDSDPVPAYGDVRVQASGQTGTSLDIANTHESPVVGDTFTIAGVAGTYTISALSYSSLNKSATLTITPSLDSSPADVAVVTFVTASSRIEGTYFCPAGVKVFCLRGGALWSSTGSGWSFVNTPDYGSVLVNGGSQTGTSLILDGVADDTYVPQLGDTFTVAGIEQVYMVTADATVSSGASTITISPALATSPADNAALTFLAISLSGGTKARFHLFNFDGTFKNVMVDNLNNPIVFTGTTCVSLQGSSDVTGASFVEEFNDHLFFAKGDLISHTAPFDETDFTTGNGAGSYRLPSTCTGIITFREQLINFSQSDIRKLQGSSLADFALTSITNDTGCIEGDSVKEVGGDVLYLAPDGIRFLGATERIGDFNLSIASRQIQGEMSEFIVSGSSYPTVTVRGKNQYRVFKYTQGALSSVAEGFVGSQFLDQNALSVNWGKTKGINVYRAHSAYTNDEEYVVFSNDDEYVYRMESGSTFDGGEIKSLFYTPFIAVNDPTLRKTAYKVDTYFDPEGTVSGTLTLKYDFNKPGKVQPSAINFAGGGVFSTYGTAVYGVSTFGGNPDTSLESRVVGSFFTASLQYEFDGGPPFILDTAVLEYATEDRK
jgi:hypothetical protein